MTDLATWASPADIITNSATDYREDLWRGQGHRVEVWIEKDALVGVIISVCQEYRVPYCAAHGNISQIEVYKAGKRFANYLADGVTPIVLHLADHDPTGIDMTRDIRERVSLYAREEIEVRRIALNIDQARRRRLPGIRARRRTAATSRTFGSSAPTTAGSSTRSPPT